MTRAARYGHGDAQIARLIARRAWRWTLYTVFLVTATAALYRRVGQGLTVQVLPSWGALLGLHGLLMSMVSRDPRVRGAWVAFGTLVAAAFTRGVQVVPARLAGSIEVIAALALVALLMSLARDDRFLADAVIESGPPRTEPPDRPPEQDQTEDRPGDRR